MRLYADRTFELRFGVRTHRDGSAQIMERKDRARGRASPKSRSRTARRPGSPRIPADRQTVFLVDSRGRDKGALFEIDLKSGNRKLVAEDNEADISSILLHPDTERPIAALAKAAKNRWHIIDESFREDFVALERFAGRGEISFNGISNGGQRFAVSIDRDDASGESVLYERGKKESRSLFRSKPKLDGVGLRPMMPVSMPARDGLVLPGYLTLPREDFRNGPLMLYIHGGPYYAR